MVKWQLFFTSFSRLEQGKKFFLRDLELTLRPLISKHFESRFFGVYLSKLQHGTPMSISLNMSGMPLHFPTFWGLLGWCHVILAFLASVFLPFGSRQKSNGKKFMSRNHQHQQNYIYSRSIIHLNNQICISWVVPPPSNSGKWRFIGIPY